MENPNQVSEAEGWHISYQIFIFTLEALARPPREACEAMGSDNPAWELRDDGMAGRYLLASHLVDTHGVSPFSVEADEAWSDELRNFAWLRHFSDARQDNERRFARTLTLDWIGREGKFERRGWALALTARRVLNWLRHFKLLVDGAPEEQADQIIRALGT